MIKHILFILLLTAGLATSAGAQSLAKELFGAKTKGSNERAAPFGGYAKGCLGGGVQLPETGPTWQAMRLSRNRNWGHPETVKFIQKLSKFAASKLANDSFDDGAAAGAVAVADALLVAADNGEAPNGSSPEAGNAGLPPFAVGGGGVAVTPLAEATEETDDRDGLPSGTLNERKIDASQVTS